MKGEKSRRKIQYGRSICYTEATIEIEARYNFLNEGAGAKLVVVTVSVKPRDVP